MTRPTVALALFLVATPVIPLDAPCCHDDRPVPRAWSVFVALLDASRQYGVDPMLAFSVAWAESRLRPWEQSRRHGHIIARGLMQISVQYQDELVAKYLGWNPSRFEWDNPVHSANLGCAYLADLVRRFGTWGAVACYNAGEGRYRQLWKGRQLPAETIEYLKGVLNE